MIDAHVRTWSERHRGRTVQFEIAPTDTSAPHPKDDRYCLNRPHHAITVIWR